MIISTYLFISITERGLFCPFTVINLNTQNIFTVPFTDPFTDKSVCQEVFCFLLGTVFQQFQVAHHYLSKFPFLHWCPRIIPEPVLKIWAQPMSIPFGLRDDASFPPPQFELCMKVVLFFLLIFALVHLSLFFLLRYLLH